MKCLLVFSAKPGVPPPTSELFLKHKDWVREQVKKGVTEVPYSFASAPGGGMCIVNLASPEDLSDLVAAAPLGPFTDVQTYLLVDFEKQMDRAAAALKRAGS